jgi:ribonuclease D
MRKGMLWIDTPEEFSVFAASLSSGPLAIDTEADSFHRYRERVCLVQVCRGDTVALIDSLALEDLSPMRGVFEDPDLRKVVHGGDYDVRLLRRDHAIQPRGLFDTMIAARLCGERSFGLAALLEKRVGVRLDKTHQRADWARRPLPEKMLTYAVEDTVHLISLAESLEGELNLLGRREWAEEEFRRLEEVQWVESSDEEVRWRRAKGLRGLNRRSLAVYRAAWRWRESRARRLDRPPFRVVREETLIEIARSVAEGGQAFAALPGAPRSWREGGGDLEGLLRSVDGAGALPEEELPEPIATRKVIRDPAFERRVSTLRAHRDVVASKLGIEPTVVASRSVLESLQRDLDKGGTGEGVPELRDWQRSALGPMEVFRARL